MRFWPHWLVGSRSALPSWPLSVVQYNVGMCGIFLADGQNADWNAPSTFGHITVLVANSL